MIDRQPDVPIFQSKGAHTKVFVEDYALDSFVNLQAIIELPEESDIVQVEEMAIFVSRDGFIIYSLELAEIENLNTYMSIDKITRVVADLCQDSSVVIDSLLTEFQRNFIEIIFGNPIHRPKTICYVGDDIKIRHDDINDYYDGEDCEIELSQILGEGHEVFQVGRNLFFRGSRGTCAIVDNFDRDTEYQITFWGIQHAINNFVDNFISRIWELYDQTKHIKKIVDEAVSGNTDALNAVQEEIIVITSTISLVGQIKEFLKDSCQELLEIYGKNHINTLDGFYEVKNSLKSSQRRIPESEKIISGLITELDGLRNYVATLSELQMRKMSKVMTKNTKSMNEVLQANTRTSEAIDMIELILAGSIILEIFAFAVGEFTSDQTIFGVIMNQEVLTGDLIATLVLFAISIVFWITIVFLLRRSKKKMEILALQDFFLTITINRKINIVALEEYISKRSVQTKHIETDQDNTIICYVWDGHDDPNLLGKKIEKVSLSYNETNNLLLFLEIETSKLDISQDKLLGYSIEDLEAKGVFIK
ncbi:MAG: hypothetical protein ACTSVO_13115 [Candidatus Heimdallarchaeaceae archaeon]